MTQVLQANKRYVVLGLGLSGLATVRFLLAQGIHPEVMDTRSHPPGSDWLDEHAPQLVTYFGELPEDALLDTDYVIISPGLSVALPAVQNAIVQGIEVIGDVELFARLNTKPVIAVTGSNGKSSVVTLTHQVLCAAGLKAALGGNIGTPVLELLDTDYDVVVLELSSFQLETTQSLRPTSSCILNITEDHMDRYSDFSAYTAAKQRIYQGAELCIYKQDDANTLPPKGINAVSFGYHQGDFHVAVREHDDTPYLYAKNQAILPLSDLALREPHNVENALAVMALVSPFNISACSLKKALGDFKGLSHRAQLVAEINGVRFINDSKATNVGAAIAAITSFAPSAKQLYLIAGGDAKGADLSPLTDVLNQHVARVFCLGKDGDAIAALCPHSQKVASIHHAVEDAALLASPGDVVLLSPACASLDMYPNFMARGDDFCQAVLAREAV